MRLNVEATGIEYMRVLKKSLSIFVIFLSVHKKCLNGWQTAVACFADIYNEGGPRMGVATNIPN